MNSRSEAMLLLQETDDFRLALRDAPAAAPLVRQRAAASAAVAVDIRALDKSFGARRVLEGFDLRIEPVEFVALSGAAAAARAPCCGWWLNWRRLAPAAWIWTARLSRGNTTTSASCSRTRGCCHGRRWPTTSACAWAAPMRRRAHVPRWARWAWPTGRTTGRRCCPARALVHAPLLLLDDPLGALDALTRIKMQRLIESV
jgi:sulfonate transport system ATP-binding protein